MKHWKIFLLFKIISTINSIEIATIRDVYFNPIGDQFSPTVTKHFHSTNCQECLCDYWSNRNTISYLLMNCFPNGTCQYFSTFPTVYSYETLIGTKIYFLENVYPQQGSCCSSNFNDIFQRIKTRVPKQMDLDLSPGSFGYDPKQNQSQAIVIDLFSNNFVRFNPFTLEKQENEFIPTTTTISLYKNLIFSALSGYPTIYVFNSSTMNILVNITYPTLSQTRKFLFLNNGQTLIATSQSNRSLTIFDINSLVNYQFQVRNCSTKLFFFFSRMIYFFSKFYHFQQRQVKVLLKLMIHFSTLLDLSILQYILMNIKITRGMSRILSIEHQQRLEAISLLMIVKEFGKLVFVMEFMFMIHWVIDWRVGI